MFLCSIPIRSPQYSGVSLSCLFALRWFPFQNYPENCQVCTFRVPFCTCISVPESITTWSPSRIILMDDAMDCLISFTDFLYAFQVQFCYDGLCSYLLHVPFFNHTLFADLGSESNCTSLLQNSWPFVLMYTRKLSKIRRAATKQSSSQHRKSHHLLQPCMLNLRTGRLLLEPKLKEWMLCSSSGLSSQPLKKQTSSGSLLLCTWFALHYHKCNVCINLSLHASCVPLSVLREILSSVESVTFYGFLMALAKSESLNKSIGQILFNHFSSFLCEGAQHLKHWPFLVIVFIGKLPHKTNLLDIPDQELTT